MLKIDAARLMAARMVGGIVPLSRRQFFRYCGRVALGGLGACVPALRHRSPARAQDNFTRVSDLDRSVHGLRDFAKAAGLVYGAAVERTPLEHDTKFAAAFIRECGLLVPENDLKWLRIRPASDAFDFASSDWMIEFASRQGLAVRGHTLCWHGANPPWLSSVTTPHNAERILTDHISTVVRRYKGRMHSWDVVNEVMHPADGRADGLRKTIWLDRLGPSYIETAFRAAAEADPDCLLVYNENRLSYGRQENATKRKAVLRLLEHLIAKGAPVHALGIQGHLVGDERSFNPREFGSFLREVEQLGLKVLITELEVIDQALPHAIETRDDAVAGAYAAYLSTALESEAVVAVVTWGLSDRYSWLRHYRPRPDGLPVRPLPLDDQCGRKAAWEAIAGVFAHVAARRHE